MTDLKFFHPKKDIPSLMGSYEYDYLVALKNTFGVTDFWATWSWGFSDATEKLDRLFLEKRLINFKRAGIRVHAYVQGPNLVRSEFPGKDYWCRDEQNRTIPYHRGRLVCCLNNPAFRRLLLGRIVRAARIDGDGVFVDNIQVGKLGIPFLDGDLLPFAGCTCDHCQTLFRHETGYEIPTSFDAPDLPIKKWYEWRVNVATRFLREAANLVHHEGKLFGSNSFDPLFPTRYCYGTDIVKIATIQDYILFENLRLPRGRQGNANLIEIIATLPEKKDVFVVSYKRGIGHDAQWNQNDIDHIFTEAQSVGFSPCLKGSEFLTAKRWHNLRPERYRSPRILPNFHPYGAKAGGNTMRKIVLKFPGVRGMLARHSTVLLTKFFENRALRAAFRRIESLLMR